MYTKAYAALYDNLVWHAIRLIINTSYHLHSHGALGNLGAYELAYRSVVKNKNDVSCVKYAWQSSFTLIMQVSISALVIKLQEPGGVLQHLIFHLLIARQLNWFGTFICHDHEGPTNITQTYVRSIPSYMRAGCRKLYYAKLVFHRFTHVLLGSVTDTGVVFQCFPRHWPFSSQRTNYALMHSLLLVWTRCWTNNHDAFDLIC